MSTYNLCFYGELTKISFKNHQIPTLPVLVQHMSQFSPPEHVNIYSHIKIQLLPRVVKSIRYIEITQLQSRYSQRHHNLVTQLTQ